MVIFFTLFLLKPAFSNPDGSEINQVYGASSNQKFTYYHPTYFVFGAEDLKIQFSGKYRLAQNYNLYFAYTQLMFWNIYDESKPFRDTLYNPELFYRLLENETSIITSLDFGYAHLSNGKDLMASRSLDKIYMKANMTTSLKSRTLLAEFELYKIRKEDATNRDIKDHIGYWDLHLIFNNIFLKDNNQIDFEFKVFAGKKGFDFDQGGRLMGLIYKPESKNFNPSIYLQYYSGYMETILSYRDRVDQVRLGLMLFI